MRAITLILIMAVTRILKESNTFPFSVSNLTTGVSATANIITRHHEPTCNHYSLYLAQKAYRPRVSGSFFVTVFY